MSKYFLQTFNWNFTRTVMITFINCKSLQIVNLFDTPRIFFLYFFFSKAKHWKVQNGFRHFFLDENSCNTLIANPAWICFCFVIHLVHSNSMRINFFEISKKNLLSKTVLLLLHCLKLSVFLQQKMEHWAVFAVCPMLSFHSLNQLTEK